MSTGLLVFLIIGICLIGFVFAVVLHLRNEAYLRHQQLMLNELLRQRQNEIDSHRRSAELSVIGEAEPAFALGSTLDLDRTLDQIVDVIVRLMKAEYASLYLVDYQRQMLVPKRIFPVLNPSEKIVELPLGESISGWVALNGKVQNIPDIKSDRRFRDPLGRGARLRCQASVPLWSGQRVIGVLNAFNKHGDQVFDDRDMQLMELMASSAARAIENARLYADAYHKAIHDPLTGLYNIDYFESRLGEEVRRAGRYMRLLAVAIFDLDDFKKFNDNYGHIPGNEALLLFSRIIVENSRDVDIAARFGGEEFILLMPETGVEALNLCDRIRDALGNSVIAGLDGHDGGRLTVSVGVSFYPLNGSSPRELLEQADKALYSAKRSGKNRVFYCGEHGIAAWEKKSG